jgi:hypothetical protein
VVVILCPKSSENGPGRRTKLGIEVSWILVEEAVSPRTKISTAEEQAGEE